MSWLLSRRAPVPVPAPPEKEMPAVANPEPSALEMTSPVHCRACTGGYGDGCCAYHQDKWDRRLERLEQVHRHRRS